jgi:putative ABC transport system permease protein
MLRDLFQHVFDSLLRNKLRSFLTMAGIAWGVASIVLIVAMGDGFRDGQRQNMRGLGENIVIVFGGRTEKQAGGQRAGRRVRTNYDDVESIRRECYRVARVVPELLGEARAASPYNSGTFEISGSEPQFNQMRTIPLGSGRYFTEQDEADAQRVCVIGDKVREQLFATRPGVAGAEIRLNGIPYRIIGVMADKNQNSSYSGRDVNKIFLPYRAMVRDLPPKDPTWQEGIVSNLIYQPADIGQFLEAQRQVRKVIGRNHRFDPADEGAVRMWDTIENAQLVDNIFISMTAFLGTIALVTLTLGGIGVMNIMLVSVTERTQEIGIRKALGATKRRVLTDFLLEGMLLALISGTIGWAFSWGLATIVNSFPMPEMFAGLPVRGSTTAGAFGALGVIAVASALWPAWRAANLTPVEALRFER